MNNPWIICPACSGNGTHTNPNIDAHGLSAEDFADDPDFAEDYFSGTYDVRCSACGGSGKIRENLLEELNQAADDRRLCALEDGDFEAYSVANDIRFGF